MNDSFQNDINKYLKYKIKYLQLKNIINGGNLIDTNINDTLKRNLNEIVNYISSYILEYECCYNDIQKFDSNNIIQKKYLNNMKELYKTFNANFMKDLNISKIEDKNNIASDLIIKLNKVNSDNFVTIFNNILWPILSSIMNNYTKFTTSLLAYSMNNKIPNFKFNMISQSTRNNNNNTCIGKNEFKKCCDLTINGFNCFDLLGSNRIPRIKLFIQELLQLFGTNENIYIKQINYLKDRLKDINKFINDFYEYNEKTNKYNKTISSSFINKIAGKNVETFTPIIKQSNVIESSNIDLFKNIDSEEKLACFLKDNKRVNDIITEIFFKTIKSAIDVGFDDSKILYKIKPETTGEYVNKPGFDDATAKKIIQIVRANTTVTNDFKEITKNNFNKVMSAFYPFTYDTSYQIKIIDKNNILKTKVLENFNQLFCVKYNWVQFKNLFNNGVNNYLLSDILAGLSTCINSIYRRNLAYKPYIRDRVGSKNITLDYDHLGCNIDAVNNKNQKVVLGSSYYSIPSGSAFAKVFTDYNRKYLAGPSGSTILLFIHTFDILGYAHTPENYNLLLAAAIGNYVPLYHTLPEILMTASFELGKHYTLDMDPVKFVIDIFKKYKTF